MEEGSAPLFGKWEQAYDFAHSTKDAAIQINSVLFDRILKLNPDIIPAKKATPEDTEGDADFLERSIQTAALPS